MYDSLSVDYDRFVNWPKRLAFEMPFIEAQLKSAAGEIRPIRVLDAACGTGMHVIELVQRDYEAVGADLSEGMIDQAIANAGVAGIQVIFKTIGFGELALAFKDFDAVLCLGNSLLHLLSTSDLSKALVDFAACIRPGGLLLIQNRNFDAVLARRERWMEPQSHRERDREWIFLRFYDFDPNELLTFHVITLYREGSGAWHQKADSSRLNPLRRDELMDALKQSGFGEISCFGSLSAEPFDSKRSNNLVIVARYPHLTI